MFKFCKVVTSAGLSSDMCINEAVSDHVPVMAKKFMDHLETHDITYGTVEEFDFRYTLFIETEEMINLHNAKDSTFKLGHNKFSTMTEEEKQKLLPEMTETTIVPTMSKEHFANGGVDWRTKGVVGPVRNQGQCGSAALFGVVDALTSANAIKTGMITDLSMEQIIDCDTDFQGCNGGTVDSVWKYVAKYGLESASDYPFTAGKGTCHYDKSKIAVKMKSLAKVHPDQSATLEAAITKEPTLVGFDMTTIAMQYAGGILDTDKCGTQINHTMLAVGFGTSGNGQDFYILKNSWGTSWGEQGYMRVAAKASGPGVCGVQVYETFPVIA